MVFKRGFRCIAVTAAETAKPHVRPRIRYWRRRKALVKKFRVGNYEFENSRPMESLLSIKVNSEELKVARAASFNFGVRRNTTFIRLGKINEKNNHLFLHQIVTSSNKKN